LILIVTPKGIRFLGDSVDSRLAHDCLPLLPISGFWGIVWTAGLTQNCDGEKMDLVFGG